jgi:hypothetical protein
MGDLIMDLQIKKRQRREEKETFCVARVVRKRSKAREKKTIKG